LEVLTHPKLNHQVDITSGILVQECATLLQKFFNSRAVEFCTLRAFCLQNKHCQRGVAASPIRLLIYFH